MALATHTQCVKDVKLLMAPNFRSGFCNFMHLKPISRKLRHELYGRTRGGGGDRERHSQVDLKVSYYFNQSSKFYYNVFLFVGLTNLGIFIEF